MDPHLEHLRAEFERSARRYGHTIPPLRRPSLPPAEQSKVTYLAHVNGDPRFAFMDAAQRATRFAICQECLPLTRQQIGACVLATFEGELYHRAGMRFAAEVAAALVRLHPSKDLLEVAADAVTLITLAAGLRRRPAAARRRHPALTQLAAKYGAKLVAIAPKRTGAEIEAVTEWAARLQQPVEAISTPREGVGLALNLDAAGLDCPVWDRILPIAPDLFTRRGRIRVAQPAKRNRPAL